MYLHIISLLHANKRCLSHNNNKDAKSEHIKVFK